MDTSTESSLSLMEQLSAQIATQVATIAEGLRGEELPFPSFEKDAPPTFPPPNAPPIFSGARVALIQTCRDLLNLALGPTDMLLGNACNDMYEIASLRAINRFNVPEAVPIDGEASFAEIADRTGVHEEFISRIIRYSATNRIFDEIRPGCVSHTAASALLRQDKGLRTAMTHNLEDLLPGILKLNEAVERFGASEEPNETALCLAYNTDKDWFTWLALPENKERLERFHQTMAYSQKSGFNANFANQSPLWDSLKPNSMVVDVGGSTGHVSMAIAKQHADLKFIVQDLPHTVNQVRGKLPAEFDDQISYMKQSFLEPQRLIADVYLLRFVLHGTSDKYAAQILGNLLPALRPGARIAIMEGILPESNVMPKFIEKFQRTGDLQMMSCFNAKERSMEQWEALIKKTDSRLRIYDVTTPLRSVYSIIVVGLDDGERLDEDMKENNTPGWISI